MAASRSTALMLASAVAMIFALIGTSAAQEAPAPSPVSAAGVSSPSLAAGCAVAVASFVFGSALRI